jgi:hypothetical protein
MLWLSAAIETPEKALATGPAKARADGEARNYQEN